MAFICSTANALRHAHTPVRPHSTLVASVVQVSDIVKDVAAAQPQLNTMTSNGIEEGFLLLAAGLAMSRLKQVDFVLPLPYSPTPCVCVWHVAHLVKKQQI